MSVVNCETSIVNEMPVEIIAQARMKDYATEIIRATEEITLEGTEINCTSDEMFDLRQFLAKFFNSFKYFSFVCECGLFSAF